MTAPYHNVPAGGIDKRLFDQLLLSTTEFSYAFPAPPQTSISIQKLPYITVKLRPLELARIGKRKSPKKVNTSRRDLYVDTFKRRIARPPMQKLGIMIETMVGFLLENGEPGNGFWGSFKTVLPLAEKIVSSVFYQPRFMGTGESLIVSQGLFNDRRHRCLVDFSWCSTSGGRPGVNFYELKVSAEPLEGADVSFMETGAVCMY
jgi:hypothetical protein